MVSWWTFRDEQLGSIMEGLEGAYELTIAIFHGFIMNSKAGGFVLTFGAFVNCNFVVSEFLAFPIVTHLRSAPLARLV